MTTADPARRADRIKLIFRLPLLFAVAFGIALRIFFALQTPTDDGNDKNKLRQYNDEQAHASYVEYLLAHRSLPRHSEPITAAGALQRGQFENYQPPLYYLVQAAICRAVGIADRRGIILLGRWTNCVLSLAIVAAGIGLLNTLAIAPGATAAAAVFMLLNGVMVRFTSTASNDPLFWLLGGVLLWILIVMYRTGPTIARLALFGLLAVAGIYTKLTFVLMLPLLGIVLWRHRNLRIWAVAAGIGALVVAATLPLWMRNVTLFGSLFPLAAGFGPSEWKLPGIVFAAFAARSFIFPWSEFWQGAYGLLFLLPPLILLLAGWRKSLMLLKPAYGSMLLGAMLVIVGAAFLWLNCRYHQAESRYLFAAWPAVAASAAAYGRSAGHLWILTALLLWPYGLFIQLPVM